MTSTWRKSASGWLRPFGVETGLSPFDPKPLDRLTIADLVKAGFVPRKDPLSASVGLEQGRVPQAVAAGKAMMAMLDRLNPNNPSAGRNRNLIDSGNFRTAQSAVGLDWLKLGVVLVDGKAWHSVREPVLVLYSGRKFLVVPADATAATKAAPGRLFAPSEWSRAAEAVAEAGYPRPECPIYWPDPAPAMAM